MLLLRSVLSLRAPLNRKCVRHGVGPDLFVPMIVFLHSLGGRPDHWAGQVDHFQDRGAVALSLPGHPGGPVVTSYTPETMARALPMDKFDRFVLVGHSGGAVVATALAKANPDRVARLVLADAGTDLSHLPQNEIDGFLNAFRQNYRESVDAHWKKILTGAKPLVREKVLADLHSTPRETITGFMTELFRFDLIGALREYPGPILSVITPLSEGAGALHNLIPRIRVTRIEGTSHWLQMDKPAEFNKILETEAKN